MISLSSLKHASQKVKPHNFHHYISGHRSFNVEKNTVVLQTDVWEDVICDDVRLQLSYKCKTDGKALKENEV